MLARKTDIKSFILVFHRQFDQLCTLMSYRFQFLLSFTELSPSEEESIDEIQETGDVTQGILIDSDDPSYAQSH